MPQQIWKFNPQPMAHDIHRHKTETSDRAEDQAQLFAFLRCGARELCKQKSLLGTRSSLRKLNTWENLILSLEGIGLGPSFFFISHSEIKSWTIQTICYLSWMKDIPLLQFCSWSAWPSCFAGFPSLQLAPQSDPVGEWVKPLWGIALH